MPAIKHAIASAAIQTRSFRKMARSWSVVLFLETSNMIHHLLKGQFVARERG
jgi:hypothetical protein